MKTLVRLSLVALSACGGKTEQQAAPEVAPVPAAVTPTARVDVPALKTDWTPEALTQACEAAEHDTDKALADLVKVANAERTFANSFGALESASATYTESIARLTFMKDIHPDAKVREAGSACEERAGKYSVTIGARKDLYDAMRSYLDNRGKTETLGAEDKRLIEITMRDFRRNGLELADDKRQELVKIRQRLAELQTQYNTHLGEDTTHFEWPASDMKGLPDSFAARHEKSKDGKKLVLTVKYPDYYPVMENAVSEDLRRTMERSFQNRGGPDNVKLLDEATKLRAQAAHLLGFGTHTDFVAEPNMAKDEKTIASFLKRMHMGLRPGLAADTQKMVELKRKETKNPKATINAWDWRYYMNAIKKRDFAIDDEEVRAYFPADRVMSGLFDVYAKLFGVEFKEVAGAKVWADGVKLYEVRDLPNGELVAKFYVDMFPRDGKYGHAAEFSMSAGHAVPEGYRIPCSVLVVNFEPPQAGKVAHLSLEEVETLFHEFGHVMHESLTTAQYASLAGTNTARDFVEAPSQMLENWVYEPSVLELLSQDPKDASKPMSRDLMDRLAKARFYNAGVFYSRQVFLGLFDLSIHTHDASSSDAIAKETWASVIGFTEDKDSHFAGTFGHMMGGYDGGYYGYLWSKVFATDMFTRFQKEGVLSPVVGIAYRDIILAKGRTVDADVLLEEFLGRKPNEDAFLVQLGITPAGATTAAKAPQASSNK